MLETMQLQLIHWIRCNCDVQIVAIDVLYQVKQVASIIERVQCYGSEIMCA
jgi:hypothetical protein